ncbi:MAG: GntR family transcriptional regulator [Burkholderiaceae bacterium]
MPRAARGLDRRSPLPLYAQVARRLKAMISAGDHPADRFYSEGELCTMFGISRATVRQAIQALSDEGWLHRQQGHGTFVNREKFDESFSPQMNFLDQWAEVGRPLQLALQRFELAPCPAEVAPWLGIEAQREILCLERVRSNGDITISYDYRYIHPDFSHSIQRDEASTTSLLLLLARSIRLVRGENKVESALAGASGASLLGVRRSDPVLIREMVYYGDDGVPAMAGRSWYRADKVRCAFAVNLTSDADQPAGVGHPSSRHPGGIADVSSVGGWPAANS